MFESPIHHRAERAASREIDAALEAAMQRAEERGDSKQLDWLLTLAFDATMVATSARRIGYFKPDPSFPSHWE